MIYPNIILAVILFLGSLILSLASYCATYYLNVLGSIGGLYNASVTAHPKVGSLQPHDYISSPLVSSGNNDDISGALSTFYQPLILDVNTLKFSPS